MSFIVMEQNELNNNSIEQALKELNYGGYPVRLAPAHRHYVERHLDCLRRIGIFPYGKI